MSELSTIRLPNPLFLKREDTGNDALPLCAKSGGHVRSHLPAHADFGRAAVRSDCDSALAAVPRP